MTETKETSIIKLHITLHFQRDIDRRYHSRELQLNIIAGVIETYCFVLGHEYKYSDTKINTADRI